MDKHTFKIQKNETFRKHFSMPVSLYARLVDHVGNGWGATTRFIIDAIKEKLDREESNHAANKELNR